MGPDIGSYKQKSTTKIYINVLLKYYYTLQTGKTPLYMSTLIFYLASMISINFSRIGKNFWISVHVSTLLIRLLNRWYSSLLLSSDIF